MKNDIITAQEFAEKFSGKDIPIISYDGKEYVAKIIGWWDNANYIVCSFPFFTIIPLYLKKFSSGESLNLNRLNSEMRHFLNVNDDISEVLKKIRLKMDKANEQKSKS